MTSTLDAERSEAATLQPSADPYENWRRRCTGEILPIINEHPEAGLYRDGDKAIHIGAKKDGTFTFKENNRPLESDKGVERWPFYVKRPVTREAYDAKIFEGCWPGETAAVTRLSNNPPAANSFEEMKAAIDELVRDAERVLKRGPAVTQVEADEAANIADMLGKLNNKADEARKVEQQPFDDEVTRVREKWRPLTTAASIYRSLKQTVIDPFLTMKREAKDKAVARAKAEAEKAQREAAEKEAAARRAAEAARTTGDTRAVAQAEQMAEAAKSRAVNAQATAFAVEAAPVTAGTRGRKTSQRTVTEVTITDRGAFIKFIDEQAPLRELLDAVLQTIADRVGKSGVCPPCLSVNKKKASA